MNNPSATPSTLGYRMPAEWEPHQATWLTWPHEPQTWPGQDMAEIEAVYIAMIRALTQGERVELLVNDPESRNRVRSILESHQIESGQVRIHCIPTNDVWIRDYGPNFLVRKASVAPLAFNNWRFNSWGAKYPWGRDDAVCQLIAEQQAFTVFPNHLVLEGGGIEVNGEGICITTEQCLLNPSRNGKMTQQEMEETLKSFLGVSQVIWCQGELVGDDTDGHIDNLARFVNPHTVLCPVEEDPMDPNHKCLAENIRILSKAKAVSGKPLEIIPLPMPKVVDSGERLPASYANFYIANTCVLVPLYDPELDLGVMRILEGYFPKRKVVGIPCSKFIWGLGGLHCVTQQQPLV